MIVACSSCGHKLWSVERELDGRVVLVYFDGENTSETYSQRVTNCPGCDRRLVRPAAEETQRPS